jgi:hypothetical protein
VVKNDGVQGELCSAIGTAAGLAQDDLSLHSPRNGSAGWALERALALHADRASVGSRARQLRSASVASGSGPVRDQDRPRVPPLSRRMPHRARCDPAREARSALAVPERPLEQRIFGTDCPQLTQVPFN